MISDRWQTTDQWECVTTDHWQCATTNQWQVTDYWPVTVCHYWPLTVCHYWPLIGDRLLTSDSVSLLTIDRWQTTDQWECVTTDQWQVTDYWPVTVCHYWPLRGAALLPLMSLTASQARWTLAVTSSTGSTLLTCDQICKPQHQPDMHKLTDHTTNSVSTDAFQVNLQCQVPSLLPQPFPEQDL